MKERTVWGCGRRAGLAAGLLLICGGCATMFFHPLRAARFIDMDARVVRVEYGEEPHEEELPNGGTLSFKGKVRLTLPGGGRVVLYQTLTPMGNLYRSKKKDYSFLESGPRCWLSHDGVLIFEGVYCRDSFEQEKKAGE